MDVLRDFVHGQGAGQILFDEIFHGKGRAPARAAISRKGGEGLQKAVQQKFQRAAGPGRIRTDRLQNALQILGISESGDPENAVQPVVRQEVSHEGAVYVEPDFLPGILGIRIIVMESARMQKIYVAAPHRGAFFVLLHRSPAG